jgi:hypothetical protein
VDGAALLSERERGHPDRYKCYGRRS